MRKRKERIRHRDREIKRGNIEAVILRTILTAKRNERYSKDEKRERERGRERDRERERMRERCDIGNKRESNEKDTEFKDKDLPSRERKRAYR